MKRKNIDTVKNKQSFFEKYGPIGNWDISKVNKLDNLFENGRISTFNNKDKTKQNDTTKFNENISGWDVSHIESMKETFKGAKSFNSIIGHWDISNVKNLVGLFENAENFDQDISEWEWDNREKDEKGDPRDPNITDISNMFKGAKNFNSDISTWDVSKIIYMNSTFQDTDKFNANISNWDVSEVLGMQKTFYNANAFNIDITKWDVINIRDDENDERKGMIELFNEADIKNKNYPDSKDINSETKYNYFELPIDKDALKDIIKEVRNLYKTQTIKNKRKSIYYNGLCERKNFEVNNETLKIIIDDYIYSKNDSIFYEHLLDLDTSQVTNMDNLFIYQGTELINKENSERNIFINSRNIKPIELTDLPKSITGPFNFDGDPQTLTIKKEDETNEWKNGNYTLTGSSGTTAAYLAWINDKGYWMAFDYYDETDGTYSGDQNGIKDSTTYKDNGETKTVEGAYWEMIFPFKMQVTQISFRIQYHNYPKEYILLGYNNENEEYIKLDEKTDIKRPKKKIKIEHEIVSKDQFSRIRFIGIKTGDTSTSTLTVHGPLNINGTYYPEGSKPEGSKPEGSDPVLNPEEVAPEPIPEPVSEPDNTTIPTIEELNIDIRYWNVKKVKSMKNMFPSSNFNLNFWTNNYYESTKTKCDEPDSGSNTESNIDPSFKKIKNDHLPDLPTTEDNTKTNKYKYFLDQLEYKYYFFKYKITRVELINDVNEYYRKKNDDKSWNEKYGPIINIDVSLVKNMRSLFSQCDFNEDISEWDVSHVTNMSYMFNNNKIFNQDITQWDVSNVTTMDSMFFQAIVFNQDISNWNVSKVTNMKNMFRNAINFNKNLAKWERRAGENEATTTSTLSKVENMTSMFENARSFNQDLSIWKVDKLESYNDMFKNTNLLMRLNQPNCEPAIMNDNKYKYFSTYNEDGTITENNTIQKFNINDYKEAFVTKNTTYYDYSFNKYDKYSYNSISDIIIQDSSSINSDNISLSIVLNNSSSWNDNIVRFPEIMERFYSEKNIINELIINELISNWIIEINDIKFKLFEPKTDEKQYDDRYTFLPLEIDENNELVKPTQKTIETVQSYDKKTDTIKWLTNKNINKNTVTNEFRFKITQTYDRDKLDELKTQIETDVKYIFSQYYRVPFDEVNLLLTNTTKNTYDKSDYVIKIDSEKIQAPAVTRQTSNSETQYLYINIQFDINSIPSYSQKKINNLDADRIYLQFLTDILPVSFYKNNIVMTESFNVYSKEDDVINYLNDEKNGVYTFLLDKDGDLVLINKNPVYVQIHDIENLIKIDNEETVIQNKYNPNVKINKDYINRKIYFIYFDDRYGWQWNLGASVSDIDEDKDGLMYYPDIVDLSFFTGTQELKEYDISKMDEYISNKKAFNYITDKDVFNEKLTELISYKNSFIKLGYNWDNDKSDVSNINNFAKIIQQETININKSTIYDDVNFIVSNLTLNNNLKIDMYSYIKLLENQAIRLRTNPIEKKYELDYKDINKKLWDNKTPYIENIKKFAKEYKYELYNETDVPVLVYIEDTNTHEFYSTNYAKNLLIFIQSKIQKEEKEGKEKIITEKNLKFTLKFTSIKGSNDIIFYYDSIGISKPIFNDYNNYYKFDNNDNNKWIIFGFHKNSFDNDNKINIAYAYYILSFTIIDNDDFIYLKLGDSYKYNDYLTNGVIDNNKFKYLELEDGTNIINFNFYKDDDNIKNYDTYLIEKKEKEKEEKKKEKEEENVKIQGKTKAFTKTFINIIDYNTNKIGIVKSDIVSELNTILNTSGKKIKELLDNNKEIQLCIEPTKFYYVDENEKENKYDLKKDEEIYEEIYEEYPIYRLFGEDQEKNYLEFDNDYVYFKINSENNEKFLKKMFDYINNNSDFKNGKYIFIGIYDATFYINKDVETIETIKEDDTGEIEQDDTDEIEQDDTGEIEQYDGDDGIKLSNGTYEFTWNTEGIINKTFSDPFFNKKEDLIKNGTFEATVNDNILKFQGTDEYGYDYEWNSTSNSYELKPETTPVKLVDYIIINSDNTAVDSSGTNATYEAINIIESTDIDLIEDDSSNNGDDNKLEDGTYKFEFINNKIDSNFDYGGESINLFLYGAYNNVQVNNSITIYNVNGIDEERIYNYNETQKRYEIFFAGYIWATIKAERNDDGTYELKYNFETPNNQGALLYFRITGKAERKKKKNKIFIKSRFNNTLLKTLDFTNNNT